MDDTESDASLPEVDDDAVTGCTEQKASSRSTNTRSALQRKRNEETGLIMIIPPRKPALRNGRRKPTLLICPTSLISQLEVHLDRSVNIAVMIHLGATKVQNVEDMDNANVVITTYGGPRI